MDTMTKAQRNTDTVNEQLANAFYKSGRYNPTFLLIAGIGVFVIYVLARYGIFGNPSPQLLYISGATLLFALSQWLILALLTHRNKGIASYFWGTLSAILFAIAITILWQNIIYLTIPVILITPAMGLSAGMPRKAAPWLVLFAVIGLGSVVFTEYWVRSVPNFERLQSNSSMGIASLAFLGATSSLLAAITFVSQNRRYRSLQGLLLASFVPIVAIPVVMVIILSGVGAYTNSQTQTFNTLKAISSLKENQISLLVNESKNDVAEIQENAAFKKNILPVLINSDPSSFYAESARSYLLFIQKEKDSYAEIFVLTPKGTTALSTNPAHTNANYETQPFFQQGVVRPFSGLADAPEFGGQNFVVATPLFDTNGVPRGVIVLRSDLSAIKRIMESTPGFPDAETYLVDTKFNPVTITRNITQTVHTEAALDAINKNIDGQAIYENYTGERVLGYYKWYEPLQTAFIAEVPVRFVIDSSIVSLTGSSLLTLFIIGIALVAGTITARSISEPITELVRVTESYLAGKLRTRANVDRKDEIGVLADSYNQMASQLQDIIGKLEQRAASRAKELEDQTLGIRVATEVASDAASARNMTELLERAADLILKRFNFYHTGIFLIDKNKEFATLTASTTDAGKQMIENGYKARVGDGGVVGRVAANGEPRIELETSSPAPHFDNPLLPDTRSEMALPLKVGNLVVGVLDLHSNQPRGFTRDDMTIMQVMADQLATAIERTRLLQEVEYNLKELEKAYGQYTLEGWQKLSSSGQIINRGYRFDNIRIEPINELPRLGSWTPTTSASEAHNDAIDKNVVAIPIKLRGQTIGVINARLKTGYNPKTISTLEAATERFASALESARLYEEARARADREQAIAQVTTKISATTEFESILRTTVEEIGKSLGNSEVSIQIIGDLDDQNPNT